MGLTEQQAFDLGANFGSGMRCGSVCGTLTGAQAVLPVAEEVPRPPGLQILLGYLEAVGGGGQGV